MPVPPFRKRRHTSEVKAGADLHGSATHRGVADGAGALRSVRSRQIHRVVEVAIGNVEVRMIEYIRRIRSKLQAAPFIDMEGLSHGEICRIDARSAQ